MVKGVRTPLDSLGEEVPKRRQKAAKTAFRRTELSPDAPKPNLDSLIANNGAEPTVLALSAWDARVRGTPIVDVAYQMGVSIEGAKELIRQAHAAIAEDLKENLEVNRQLDLARIDGMLAVYYPAAKGGDMDAAALTLKCMQHRAKLCGIEPQLDPGRSNPQSILVWIQHALPSINKIVDGLPAE
jgi:hypothetical protein